MTGRLEVKVRLVGRDAIHYVEGETEAWMYVSRPGNISRYNLSYDQSEGAYTVRVPEICEPVDLVVYGRVEEKSEASTVRAECACWNEVTAQGAGDQPPEMIGLTAQPGSPQEAGVSVTWTVNATDPDGDRILYRFLLDGEPMTDWIDDSSWSWTAADPGSYRIEAQVRDGDHAGPNGADDRMSDVFEITEPVSAAVAQDENGTDHSPDDGSMEDIPLNSTESQGGQETEFGLISVLGDPSICTYSVAFSPDGWTLASGDGNGVITLWDVDSGNEIRTLTGHTSWVWSLDFSPDGRTLASGANDNTVKAVGCGQWD